MSRTTSRRTFLQGTAAGTALATAAHLSYAADAAAGDKLVVGVMGMGGRGTALAKGFEQLDGVEVAYVCGTDRNRMNAAVKAVAAINGRTPKAVGDFRRILEDKSVDILVCAAPDHWHGPATIMACNAGKHVYVEKPCCHNPAEGEMMVAAARKHKRVVQIGTQRRSWPAIQKGMRLLGEGAVGRRLFARGWYNNMRGSIGRGTAAEVPAHLDWELWQGPAPRREYRSNIAHYNWHWFWHWGTGEIGNNGVHALDLCRWGMDVDYPQRVTSGGGIYYFDDDQQTPDSQVVTYEFGDRMITWEGRNWHPRGFEGQKFGAAVYGDNGTMMFLGSGYKLYDRSDKLVAEETASGGDAGHLTNFVDTIRGQETANAEIEKGYKSTLLCLLGSISHRTGHALKCDPAYGRILDDEDAVKLWTREYEPDWTPMA